MPDAIAKDACLPGPHAFRHASIPSVSSEDGYSSGSPCLATASVRSRTSSSTFKKQENRRQAGGNPAYCVRLAQTRSPVRCCPFLGQQKKIVLSAHGKMRRDETRRDDDNNNTRPLDTRFVPCQTRRVTMLPEHLSGPPLVASLSRALCKRRSVSFVTWDM